MLGTLVVGLDRAGAAPHLPVLRRLRPRDPVYVLDPHRTRHHPGAITVDSPRAVGPAGTVVHVETPAADRVATVAELAALGFRRFVIAEPVAVGDADLADLRDLRDAHDLDLLPFGRYRDGELTRRLLDRAAIIGSVRAITITHSEPGYARAADGASAFDTEAAAWVRLAVDIAGPATVLSAGCSDLLVGDAALPAMGGVTLRLRHQGGVVTEIRTDLTAPIRERRVTIDLDVATLVGHYPVGAEDDHAHLRVSTRGHLSRAVFRDDSAGSFLDAAYRHFDGTRRLADEPEAGFGVVELIADAKALAAGVPA